MPRPRVILLTTGGTIASTQTSAGAVPTVRGWDLIRPSYGDVEVREICALDSSSMTPATIDLIRDSVAAALSDPDVDAVVITHGTDTLEETAIGLDLCHHDARAVVLTGAQHTFDHPDSDGPANLSLAFATAHDPRRRGQGVLVAFGTRVLPARGVAKVSTTERDGFASIAPTLVRVMPPGDRALLAGARVEILTLYPGIGPDVVGAVCQGAGTTRRPKAIVLAGTGSGNTHPSITAATRQFINSGGLVAVSTRVPFGPVSANYGGGGGAVDLVAAGAMVSKWLRPSQLRILLLDLLSRGLGDEQIAEAVSAANTSTERAG